MDSDPRPFEISPACFLLVRSGAVRSRNRQRVLHALERPRTVRAISLPQSRQRRTSMYVCGGHVETCCRIAADAIVRASGNVRHASSVMGAAHERQARSILPPASLSTIIADDVLDLAHRLVE